MESLKPVEVPYQLSGIFEEYSNSHQGKSLKNRSSAIGGGLFLGGLFGYLIFHLWPGFKFEWSQVSLTQLAASTTSFLTGFFAWNYERLSLRAWSYGRTKTEQGIVDDQFFHIIHDVVEAIWSLNDSIQAFNLYLKGRQIGNGVVLPRDPDESMRLRKLLCASEAAKIALEFAKYSLDIRTYSQRPTSGASVEDSLRQLTEASSRLQACLVVEERIAGRLENSLQISKIS